MTNQKEQERNKKIRLLADHLCYQDGGADALRFRTGNIRADRNWWDKYDTQAKKKLQQEENHDQTNQTH